MIILFTLFITVFVLGQLGGIAVAPNIVIYIHDIVIALMVVWVGIHFRAYFAKIPTKITRTLLVFICWMAFSLLWNFVQFSNQDIFVASLYLVRWVGYSLVAVYVTGSNYGSAVWRRALFMAGTAFALLGLLQFFLYPNLTNLIYLGWDQHQYRVFSTLLDPNFTGGILVLTGCLGLPLLLEKRDRRWGGIALVLVAVTLVLTYSRSSYLAAIVAALYLSIKKGWWKQGLIAVLLFLVAIVYVPKLGGDTLRLDRLTSIEARVGSWQDGWRLFVESPIVGHGFNTLGAVRQKENPTSSAAYTSKSRAGIDSSLLFLLATGGIVGFAIYIYLCWQLWQESANDLVLRSSMVALFVHSWFVNSLFYPWVMIWMWVLVGSIAKKKSTYDN